MTPSSSKISAMTRVMLVDDDDTLRMVLHQQLSAEGILQIEEAGSVAEAHQKIDAFAPDIILLDVQLPDGNGFMICKRLRDAGFDKPILMLTGQDSEDDIIQGLEAGANDYIAKPMRMRELLARMRTHLRQHQQSDEARFDVLGFDFVPATKTIMTKDKASKVLLTEKETMIMKMLIRRAPDAVSREELLSEIWGFQKGLTTHTLETHIYRLRQKFTRLSELPIIETTDDGYRLSHLSQG